MAGLDQSLPDNVGGVGGVSSMDSVSPSAERGLSLSRMDKNLSDLTERSEKLQQFFTDQKLLLSSTPSIWPVRGYLLNEQRPSMPRSRQ